MEQVESVLSSALSRTWWVLLLRGLAAIVFGVVTWTQPALPLMAVVLFFGVYFMIDGLLSFWSAMTQRHSSPVMWDLVLHGLVGVGIGMITLFAPAVTMLTLFFYVAIWAIAKGVLEIVTAIRLRKEIQGEWLYVLGGLCSVAFGIFLVVWPHTGMVALMLYLSLYAWVYGVLLLSLAFRARQFSVA